MKINAKIYNLNFTFPMYKYRKYPHEILLSRRQQVYDLLVNKKQEKKSCFISRRLDIKVYTDWLVLSSLYQNVLFRLNYYYFYYYYCYCCHWIDFPLEYKDKLNIYDCSLSFTIVPFQTFFCEIVFYYYYYYILSNLSDSSQYNMDLSLQVYFWYVICAIQW